MKTSRFFIRLLFVGVSIAMSGGLMSVSAQSSTQGESPVPVIPPGKVGAQPGPSVDTASPAIDLTIGELMERPKDYVGRNVTVVGRVEETFTPWSFKMDEDQLMAGGIDNDLLVIGAEPHITMGFSRDWFRRTIRVTGTIRILQAEDFQRDYGRGVDDKLFRRYEGKPALIATSMKAVR